MIMSGLCFIMFYYVRELCPLCPGIMFYYVFGSLCMSEPDRELCFIMFLGRTTVRELCFIMF